MGPKKVTVGIWVSPDIVAQVDHRRGPLSRSAYLKLVLKEAFEENKSIQVMHLSKLRREKLATNRGGTGGGT